MPIASSESKIYQELAGYWAETITDQVNVTNIQQNQYSTIFPWKMLCATWRTLEKYISVLTG